MRTLVGTLSIFSIAVGWACNVLAIEPGKRVAISVEWPGGIYAGPEGHNSELNFDVFGCDDFTLQLLHHEADDDSWQSSPLSFDAHGQRHYTAHVTRDRLSRMQNARYADARHPLDAEIALRVRCTADGREATSATIPVQFVPAQTTRWIRGSNPDGMIAMNANGHAFAWGTGWMAVYHPDAVWPRAGIDGAWVVDMSPVSGWSFVEKNDVGYVASRCAHPSCGTFTLPNGEVTQDTSYVYTLDLGEYDPPRVGQSLQRPLLKDFVLVPGLVTKLRPDKEGIRVLTLVPGKPSDHPWQGLQVYQVADNRVEFLYGWPEESLAWVGGSGTLQTDFFLTRKQDRVLFRSLSTDVAIPLAPIPGVDLEGRDTTLIFYVSPDGTRIVAATESALYTSRIGGPWTTFYQGKLELALYQANVYWNQDVLMWVDRTRDAGSVVAFDLEGNNTRILLQNASIKTSLMLRDGRLAVQRDNDILLVDANGVSGTIELPVGCGALEMFAQLSDDTLVAAEPDGMTYFFDVN